MPQWSFVYQYAIGGIVFLLSLVLLVRSGAIRLTQPAARRSLAVIVAGLLFYAGLHAVSVFLLPGT